MNITNGCTFDNPVAPLFHYYVQSAQLIQSTKVQVPTMTTNTILMTYQIRGKHGPSAKHTCRKWSQHNAKWNE